MFAYIKYVLFSHAFFKYTLTSFQWNSIKHTHLSLSYYKNYGEHYRYCYIIHFEIQYMQGYVNCVLKKGQFCVNILKILHSCINFVCFHVLCGFFPILHFMNHICNKFHENAQLCDKYSNFLSFLPYFTSFLIFLHLWKFRVFCFFMVPFHFFHYKKIYKIQHFLFCFHKCLLFMQCFSFRQWDVKVLIPPNKIN